MSMKLRQSGLHWPFILSLVGVIILVNVGQLANAAQGVEKRSDPIGSRAGWTASRLILKV